MDKVKQYLELAHKHHFWILCALAAVVSLIAWQMSTGKLAAEFAQEKTNIETEIRGLNPNPDQAREDWAPTLAKETKKVIADVQQAWDELYSHQKEKICIWPKELSAEFLKAVPDLDGPNPYLPNDLRNYYQDKLKKQLALKLPPIVDAALPDEQPVQGPNGPVPVEHKVEWPTFGEILKSFEWDLPPTPLLVKYAQEELWVYEALCNIVKSVNDGSTGKHDAVITEIIDMKIAYTAAEPVFGGGAENRLEPLPIAGSDPSANEPAAAADPSTEKPPPPNPTERGKEEGARDLAAGDAAAPTSPDTKWKNWRYVKVSPMGEAMMAPDVDAAGKELYKLMPFKLTLGMDGRHLDRLLVACRNSVLPLEVQQVRIGPQVTGGVSASPASNFSFAPRPSGSISRSEHDDHGPSARSGGGSYRPSTVTATPGTAQQHSHKVNVELRGVVYLLNPPVKLGPAEEQETPRPNETAAVPPLSSN